LRDSLNGLSMAASDSRWVDWAVAQEYLREHYFPSLHPRLVLGEGDPVNPRVMIVGGAPGAAEAMAGRPFVGKTGAVLRDLMELAGLCVRRGSGAWWDAHPELTENAWLTYVVPFRPGGNRTPTLEEVRAFRRMLKTEWRMIGCPRIIVPIGKVALYAVTGKRFPLTRVSGSAQRYTGSHSLRFLVMPMINPAQGIENPALRPILERDWGRLANAMASWQGRNPNA
jgi:uracil-DNA glycosylase family 4